MEGHRTRDIKPSFGVAASVNTVYFLKSQNHRIVGVGKDVDRSLKSKSYTVMSKNIVCKENGWLEM